MTQDRPATRMPSTGQPSRALTRGVDNTRDGCGLKCAVPSPRTTLRSSCRELLTCRRCSLHGRKHLWSGGNLPSVAPDRGHRPRREAGDDFCPRTPNTASPRKEERAPGETPHWGRMLRQCPLTTTKTSLPVDVPRSKSWCAARGIRGSCGRGLSLSLAESGGRTSATGPARRSSTSAQCAATRCVTPNRLRWSRGSGKCRSSPTPTRPRRQSPRRVVGGFVATRWPLLHRPALRGVSIHG
jgi:hypothetical protein